MTSSEMRAIVLPTTFTIAMARTRQETWGKEKRFREGQAEQVLDTLFFDFIDVVRKLRPKVVIAENVKGLLQGAAKKYVQRIHMEFEDAGYSCQHFLLDAQYMGVPQHRERVFFVCLRNDLIQYVPTAHTLFDTYPVINLNFNEKPITCEEAHLTLGDPITTPCYINEYKRLKNGEETKYQQCALVDKDMVHPTILAGYRQKASPMPSWGMNWLSNESVCKVSSFPTDYDFGNQKPYYVCGMSVPPVMMAQVASRIYEQWLSKIK